LTNLAEKEDGLVRKRAKEYHVRFAPILHRSSAVTSGIDLAGKAPGKPPPQYQLEDAPACSHSPEITPAADGPVQGPFAIQAKSLFFTKEISVLQPLEGQHET
jgi:hypothetical protein